MQLQLTDYATPDNVVDMTPVSHDSVIVSFFTYGDKYRINSIRSATEALMALKSYAEMSGTLKELNVDDCIAMMVMIESFLIYSEKRVPLTHQDCEI